MDKRIEQAVEGDQVALSELLFEYHDRLHRFINSKLSGAARAKFDADDVVQQAFVTAIRSIGEHNGTPYFSMAYVEGQSLESVIREHPLPALKAAEYVQKLAAAMSYAHGRGVLHRDLKPANIIVDTNDDPHITDFGLAKRVGADSTMTVTGQILGTPSFMPPEQALAQRGEVDERSDVYSLGAILYTLLVGRPPFKGATLAETLLQVATGTPELPSHRQANIPSGIEAVCMKCGKVLKRFLCNYPNNVWANHADLYLTNSISNRRTRATSLEKFETAGAKSVWKREIDGMVVPGFVGSLELGEIYVVTESGRVLSFDLERGTPKRNAQLGIPSPRFLAGAQNGQVLAVAGHGKVAMIESSTLEVIEQLEACSSTISCLSVGESGAVVAAGYQTGDVQVWHRSQASDRSNDELSP